MDAPRTDVESCALLKHARGCKLTLLVAIQNVILTGCLLAVLYVYWTGTEELQDNDVYIAFEPISDVYGNAIMEFKTIHRQQKMNISDSRRISTMCTGPYILHMYVCYKSEQGMTNGTLQLQVAGTTDSLCTFELHASSDVPVCRGLQSNVYLLNGEETVMRLHSPDNFWIKKLNVNFNYLASSCIY